MGAKQTCKPSSVFPAEPANRKQGTVTIYLGLPLPEGSSDQPGDRTGRSSSPYSVLLLMGFSQPASHPAAGELLPHHFTLTQLERYVSVALSVELPLLGVTQHLAR